MHSSIYTGSIRHRRFEGRPHQFEYPLFMVYLDLDELAQLPQTSLLNMNQFALSSFWRKDYLPSAERNLSQAVKNLLERRTGHRPRGSVRMLTHLRYLGYLFNPASFFFCFDPQENLESLITEVTNTPWKERHAYVLNQNLGSSSHYRFESPKNFHVSPFFDMDQSYVWSGTLPGKHLSMQIENQRNGEAVFDATLKLKRIPLTQENLLKTWLKYPMMTAQVSAGIHWEALKRWLKGNPYIPHPNETKNERTSHAER